jgi:hypothetical protein
MPEWENDTKRIDDAITEALKIPGVHSAFVGPRYRKGQETDEMALCVLVRLKLPFEAVAPHDLVPEEIAGIPTDVIEGDLPHSFTADDPVQPPLSELPFFDDEEYSQIRGGIRIEAEGMGTLGCIGRATDATNNNRLVILSNQHVLSKSSGPGEKVRQPNVSCCCCGHKIAVVLRARNTMTGAFYKNQPNVPNIDAAIALLEPGIQCLAEIQIGVGSGTAAELVRGLVPAADIKAPLAVKKRGSRTGATQGIIVSNTKSLAPEGNSDKAMAYRRQLLIRPSGVPAAATSGTFRFAAGGDSGSLLLSQAGDHVAGLVWGAVAFYPLSPNRNLIVVHGLATNIHDVISGMQISIETTSTAGQIITVPAPAAPPQPSSALNPQPQPMMRSMIEEASFQIERTTYGLRYATTFRRHHAEVLDLVRTNRRVGAIWKRYGGQSILQAVLDAVGRPDEPIPSVVGSHPLTKSAARIASILRRYGSAALRRDVDEYERIIGGVCGCTYNQLLARLQAGDSLSR